MTGDVTMNEPNGESRLDRLERLAEKNLDEHERIWKSIEALRDQDFEITTGIKSLIGAIRDLIDRIPPETLRPAVEKKGTAK
jgi:hypothetical protein